MDSRSEYERVIQRLDKQIGWEIAKREKLEYCPSYWHKQLFIKTADFTLDDWRNIRGPEYFKEKAGLKGIEELKFTLEKVNKYLKDESSKAKKGQ